MTSQRYCYTRDPQNHVYIFSTSRCGTSLANFGFAMYQNQIFRHNHNHNHNDNTIKAIGHSDTSVHSATRLMHWLIPVAPSHLRSHNVRYIMLKSLRIGQTEVRHCLYKSWLSALMPTCAMSLNELITARTCASSYTLTNIYIYSWLTFNFS